MDLQVLMTRVMADPVGLLERVAQQALDQLERDGALAGDGAEPPDQQLASALGNRLARMVARKDAPAVQGWPATGQGGGALARYEELVERNSALAAALGACDCWGEDIDCPVCDGLGEPGWALPDERLFATYVQPAVRAARRPDGPPSGAGRNGRRRRKERGDVQHVTR
jgi:hypothetical protein